MMVEAEDRLRCHASFTNLLETLDSIIQFVATNVDLQERCRVQYDPGHGGDRVW